MQNENCRPQKTNFQYDIKDGNLLFRNSESRQTRMQYDQMR